MTVVTNLGCLLRSVVVDWYIFLHLAKLFNSATIVYLKVRQLPRMVHSSDGVEAERAREQCDGLEGRRLRKLINP